MRGTRHSEEQIIAILKQADNGVKTAELCRQHGIVEQTRRPANAEEERAGGGSSAVGGQ